MRNCANMKHTLDPQYFESPTRIDNTALNMQHETDRLAPSIKCISYTNYQFLNNGQATYLTLFPFLQRGLSHGNGVSIGDSYRRYSPIPFKNEITSSSFLFSPLPAGERRARLCSRILSRAICNLSLSFSKYLKETTSIEII